MTDETVVPLLSTGQPSTLGVYYENTVALLGKESRAAIYLAAKIAVAPNGCDEIILADEGQMMILLAAIHTDSGYDPTEN